MAITAGDWPLVPGARAFARIPAATLSSTAFFLSLASGAEIATINTNLAGAVVDGISSADGKVILSQDKTKIIRGLEPVVTGDLEFSIFVSHPKAENSPVETKLKLTVKDDSQALNLPEYGLVSTAGHDGSVGQTYTGPNWAFPQWYRETLSIPKVRSKIAGATSRTYVATLDDVGYRLAMFGVDNGNPRLAATRTVCLKAPVVISLCDTAGDFYIPVGSGRDALSIDTADKVSGTGSLLVSRNVDQYGEFRLQRDLANLDFADLETMAFAYKPDPNALNLIQAAVGRGGTLYGQATDYEGSSQEPPVNNDAAVRFGWSWHGVDLKKLTGTLPTGAGQAQARLRIDTRSPFNQRTRFDAVHFRGRGRAIACWTFDDNHFRQYDFIKNVLVPLGIPATIYACPGYIGNANRLTWAMLRELDAIRGVDGQPLVDIGVNPQFDGPLTEHATVADAVAMMLNVRQIVLNNGISDRAVDHLCYSNGAYQIMTGAQRLESTLNGTATVTFAADPGTPLVPGMPVQGFGVSEGTTVRTVNNAREIVLSAAATLGTAGTTVTRQLAFINTSAPFYGRKLPDALAAAGFKTGRTTEGRSNLIRYGFAEQAMMLRGKGFSLKRYASIKASYAEAVSLGNLWLPYCHDLPAEGETQGIGIYRPDMEKNAADIAADRDAGLVDSMTISQIWSTYGGARYPA